MVADPGAEAPTVPQPKPGEEPTVPVVTPPSPATPTVTAPTVPVGGPPTVASPTAPVSTPAPKEKAPEPPKVSGRVIVPGATPPGAKKVAAPTAPTQTMARQDTAVGPRPAAVRAPVAAAQRRPAVRRRRSGFRRFVTAVIALVLVIAVPVVSAYVSYKLASGENPFEWPPTVDVDSFFPR